MKKQNLDELGGRRVTALRDNKRDAIVMNENNDLENEPRNSSIQSKRQKK